MENSLLAGIWHDLNVVKEVEFGLYLDGGDAGEILLPKRFAPKIFTVGGPLHVFIYHDSENRLIATTQEPKGIVGDIILLYCLSTTEQGAFLDWGLMKDLFVPVSQQTSNMVPGGWYLIAIYRDEQTGRVAGTERILPLLSNDNLTVKELDEVELTIWNPSDIGFHVIINNKHTGVLHFNDVFRELELGEKTKGFIKKIRTDNKIDVALGERGYQRVSGEAGKILQLLHENDNYLPYHDKSTPEEIYNFFGMSKKTFKMTLGKLYKEKKIELTQTGFKLSDEANS